MEKTGSAQMPALELGDGRWMSDSTPIIQWFETAHPAPVVTPVDPLQRFFSLLLEDYTAQEGLRRTPPLWLIDRVGHSMGADWAQGRTGSKAGAFEMRCSCHN